MNFGGATKATGFSKVIPTYSSVVSPYGKGFAGKPLGAGIGGFGIGKPFGVGKIGGFNKPFVGGFGKGTGKGFPATKSSGFSSVIPTTTVATSPVPGGFI